MIAPDKLTVPIADYERQLALVSMQMSAPDFFPTVQPENDLKPEPARLQAQIFSLRYHVASLETRVTALEKSK